MTYTPAEDRYERMPYRRCGRSGLRAAGDQPWALAQFRRGCAARARPGDLPDGVRCGHHPFRSRQQLRAAAGQRRGSFGDTSRNRLPRLPRPARDLVEGRLRHVARTLRRMGAAANTSSPPATTSLKRMGLAYVDLFYSHRFDPGTPLEETHGGARPDRAIGQGALLSASRPTIRSAPARRRRSSPTSARPASSTSLATTCSTCWVERDGLRETAGGARHSARSPSCRWPAGAADLEIPRAVPPARPRATQARSLDAGVGFFADSTGAARQAPCPERPFASRGVQTLAQMAWPG